MKGGIVWHCECNLIPAAHAISLIYAPNDDLYIVGTTSSHPLKLNPLKEKKLVDCSTMVKAHVFGGICYFLGEKGTYEGWCSYERL